MRKKELRARNDQLRRELLHSHQLSASQVKQINEHRMELAILGLDRPLARSNGSLDVAGAVATGDPCPTCGQRSSARAGTEPENKACPDCAEIVRAAAHKCRYCGYRFDGVERRWTENGSRESASNGSAPVARLDRVTTT